MVNCYLGQRYRCGLPPEEADQIFRGSLLQDNGTGMGLPISRSIIESHAAAWGRRCLWAG